MKKLLLETSFSKIYMIIMILITLLVIGGYFSYAMFTVTKEKNNAISIVTGSLDYLLTVDGEETDSLSIPANSMKEFIITLSNPNERVARFNFYYVGSLSSNVEAGYVIDCESNSIPEAKGVNLEKSGTSGSSNVYKIMVENNTSSSVTIELGVKVGLDYNDLELPSNGHLFEEYVDTPNAPELDEGMIAVSYNGSSWEKADITNTDNNWYNYNEQKWANAVTVSSSTRSTYQSASVGTTISMNDIETMWVWIPRYSYTIGGDGTNYYGKKGCYLESEPTLSLPGEIDIKFVSTDTKDRGSAKYITTTGSREYYTPDGFTFGDSELSGIWVGKFESSSSNPNAEYGGGNTTELDAMIKPNVTSWRLISVSNAFNVSLKMNDEGNRYGFSSEVDTHMMKNSEWALVAYLSQSKYGKIGNINFSGTNKEIYQNKSDSLITGCSFGKPSGGTEADCGCQYTYDIELSGTGASTTGNIYGIYDMSGGSWEYVMGNYNDLVGGSGFSTMPDTKYYDKYTSDNLLTACNNKECLSHALSETMGWYGDYVNILNATYPWLQYGGGFYYSEIAGIFSFSTDTNNNAGGIRISFRLVANIS